MCRIPLKALFVCMPSFFSVLLSYVDRGHVAKKNLSDSGINYEGKWKNSLSSYICHKTSYGLTRFQMEGHMVGCLMC
jgi:hypothetical protein